MNRLWAPWRKKYIRPSRRKKVRCVFCAAVNQKRDKENLLVYRSASSFAILNLYPYNNGHVMVVPRRHVSRFDQLSDAEKLDWLNLSEKVMNALEQGMNAQGFNAGMNLGQAAGAGIPGHLHFHIVPRWVGDHNFMPVLGNTKVISESLDSAYAVLFKTLHNSVGFQGKRK